MALPGLGDQIAIVHTVVSGVAEIAIVGLRDITSPGLVTRPGSRRVGSGPDVRLRRECPALPSMVLVLWTFRDQHGEDYGCRAFFHSSSSKSKHGLDSTDHPGSTRALGKATDVRPSSTLHHHHPRAISISCYGRPQVPARATSS